MFTVLGRVEASARITAVLARFCAKCKPCTFDWSHCEWRDVCARTNHRCNVYRVTQVRWKWRQRANPNPVGICLPADAFSL
jgi:hypothetical protein